SADRISSTVCERVNYRGNCRFPGCLQRTAGNRPKSASNGTTASKENAGVDGLHLPIARCLEGATPSTHGLTHECLGLTRGSDGRNA
ncbi:MAG: hypothetical protein WA991_14730, partial [Ornithinimicrobium sp.]